MKIMFFTDTHGDEDALNHVKERIEEEDVELAVCAGDISVFEENIHPLLRKVNRFGVPVLMMPGNHESEEFLSKACNRYKHIEYINNGCFEMDDVFLICIEGNGFARKDSEFERVAKKILPILHKKKKLSYVLVTHAVPYNTKLDKLGDSHVGNKSIRAFIRKTKPIYAICGHLHENERKKDKIGKTILVNPGMYGMIFDI